MHHRASTLLLLLLALTVLPGCELIGDILKLGFWTGVIVVVIVVAAIWALVRKLGGRRRM